MHDLGHHYFNLEQLNTASKIPGQSNAGRGGAMAARTATGV
jgi:hypothetical protein